MLLFPKYLSQHYFYYFTVGLRHTALGKLTYVLYGSLNTACNDTVAAVELLAVHIHLHTEKSRFYR